MSDIHALAARHFKGATVRSPAGDRPSVISSRPATPWVASIKFVHRLHRPAEQGPAPLVVVHGVSSTAFPDRSGAMPDPLSQEVGDFKQGSAITGVIRSRIGLLQGHVRFQ
jgi:hypothetical protein